MTASDLRIINANYYKGPSFKRKYQFNTDLVCGNICYWQKKGIIIFYFITKPILQKIINNKQIKLNNGIKINKLYYDLFVQLTQIINRHINVKQYYQYVFCGHSIGGTIASIALYYAINMTYGCDYNYNLITYGSLPVGNKQYCKYMRNNCDVYEYLNYNDKIKVPIGYSNIGNKILLDSGGHNWIDYFNNLNQHKGNLIINE